ncbi:MAG: hypothetical protein DRQ88_09335 [Epsilonproteobacteria bacterium]|nr:MAG: hypothetical protein DRQ88_09335 [Campylobacterota bacterium]
MSEDINSLNYYASVLEDIHEHFRPHTGQVLIGKALFGYGNSMVFVQCGRKFGKTCFALYSLFRFAMCFPNSACYYFAPYLKQGAEIVWHPKYMQNFFPESVKKKYGIKFNNGDYRATFANGSFIKIEGCDNVHAVAGLNPHFVVLDELKDVKGSFWEVMEPNLLAKSAPILVVGSPPDNEDNLYVKLANECKSSPNKAYFKMPSQRNPHISHDYLMEKKEALIKRGELDVWEREYMANIIFGGQKFIFPMLDPGIHVKPHKELLIPIQQRRKDYDYYCSFDPGTTSCFAVLLVAIHKYTKKVVLLDEIYEKNQSDAVTKSIWNRAVEKMRAINPIDDDWIKIYDYAAAWFANEVQMQFGEAIFPCTKDLKNKEMKLSLIKELMVERLMLISDKCVNFFWEARNYRKDENGKIPKVNDHLLDDFRYILNTAHYYSLPNQRIDKRSDWRGYTAEHDMIEIGIDSDPFNKTLVDYYE